MSWCGLGRGHLLLPCTLTVGCHVCLSCMSPSRPGLVAACLRMLFLHIFSVAWRFHVCLLLHFVTGRNIFVKLLIHANGKYELSIPEAVVGASTPSNVPALSPRWIIVYNRPQKTAAPSHPVRQLMLMNNKITRRSTAFWHSWSKH